jgi:hypothetical protein
MTFLEALHAAQDTHDARDYITRVKAVMRGQLNELDEGAQVEDTHYFNHSAIPDFKVSWPGERGERNVFLRDSYGAIAIGNDEAYLAPLEPVLISLDATPEQVELAYREPQNLAAQESQRSLRTLVTDASAVGILNELSGTEFSPLASLIRSNFIRGAKGHIDADKVGLLLHPASQDAGDDASDITSRIRESFTEDAALRISRSAQLIALAMGEVSTAAIELQLTDSGHLSLAEMRTLLPWLLAQSRARSNPTFWQHIGRLMSFQDLERIRDDLGTTDLTPLILANSETWGANWAYLGLAIPRSEDASDSRISYWSFAGGRLGIDVGEERILIAKNGQLVTGRPSSSAAQWNDVAQSLSDYRLSGVSLQGIRRSVSVDAEQSDDVRRDIDEVANSLEDNYVITKARVRVAGVGDNAEQSAEVDIDFGASLLKSNQLASISDLVGIVGKVLKYRNPFSIHDIDELTGRASGGSLS